MFLSALPHYRVPVCDDALRESFRVMKMRHTEIHDVGLLYNGEYMYCSSMKGSTHLGAASEASPGAVAHLSFRAVQDNLTDKNGLLVEWTISKFVSIGAFIRVDSLGEQSMQTDLANSYRLSLKLDNGVSLPAAPRKADCRRGHLFTSSSHRKSGHGI